MKFVFGSSKTGNVTEALQTIQAPEALLFVVSDESMLADAAEQIQRGRTVLRGQGHGGPGNIRHRYERSDQGCSGCAGGGLADTCEIYQTAGGCIRSCRCTGGKYGML